VSKSGLSRESEFWQSLQLLPSPNMSHCSLLKAIHPELPNGILCLFLWLFSSN
jgi:hypothetical protein